MAELFVVSKPIFFSKLKGLIMKKILFVIFGVSLLSVGPTYAAQVRDWRDIEAVHQHVVEAIHELERVQAANHYKMQGHASKAKEALIPAEHELQEAIRAAKSERY